MTEKLNIDPYRSNSINVAPVTSVTFAQNYKGKIGFVAGGNLQNIAKGKVLFTYYKIKR